MSSSFEIKLLNIHWLNDAAEDIQGGDLCAHSDVYLRIGDEILSDKGTGPWTVSATGLYLLRTLTQNYTPSMWSNFLLPCCGHFFVKEKEEPVAIIGCDIGVDWTITHEEDNNVRHVSEKGSVATISESDYRAMIFDFTGKIEDFYARSRGQIFEEKYQKEGYEAFWAEWHELRK
jgi:hypothetical protein